MGLKALELMRFSLVLFEGKLYKVKAVSELIMLEGKKEWLSAEFINGEPLSEDWLVKFGFEKVGGLDISNTWSNGKIGITLHSTGVFQFYASLITYQYVHQLQMLHFILTEQHLPIPKLPK